jgi:hypothetical protein
VNIEAKETDCHENDYHRISSRGSKGGERGGSHKIATQTQCLGDANEKVENERDAIQKHNGGPSPIDLPLLVVELEGKATLFGLRGDANKRQGYRDGPCALVAVKCPQLSVSWFQTFSSWIAKKALGLP